MSDREDRNTRKRSKQSEVDHLNDEIMQTSPAQPTVDAAIVEAASRRIKKVKVWLIIGEVPMFRLFKTAESYGMATGLLYRIDNTTQPKSMETAKRIAEGSIEFGVDFRNFTVLCATDPRLTKSQTHMDAIVNAADVIVVVRLNEQNAIVAAEELYDYFKPK